MHPIPVSVVIITRNEEQTLSNTLRHLQDFAEVIIVDSNSTDATTHIAKQHQVSVKSFTWNGLYPKKKQWSLENSGASNDWILLLDADEYPSDSLIREIRELWRTRDPDRRGAYDVRLNYQFAGRFLRHGHKVTKRSLLHRQRAAFPEVDDLEATGIREVEGHYQPQSAYSIGRLKKPLVHDDRDPVATWFDRHNKYSDWEAYLRQNVVARKTVAAKRSRNGAIFDQVPFKPLVFFIYGYIGRGGFLDRRAGFDYHVALAVYYWQIGIKAREIGRQYHSGASAGDSPDA